MTLKEFFKSTSFKCIAALLAILLVCGIFLTIAYGFLEVSDSERLQRAIDKMYSGGTATVQDEDIFSSASTHTYGQATITAAHVVKFTPDDGEEQTHVLVQARGAGGYSGGSVTVWVASVIVSEEIESLYSISIASNAGQTLMSSINSSTLLDDIKKGYTPDTSFATGDGYVVSGATFTSSAILNAVNGAVRYTNVEYLKKSYENPYADFEYTDYINTDETTYSVENGVVTYNIVTTSNGNSGAFTITIVVGTDQKVTSYTILTNGGTEDKYKDPASENAEGFVGQDAAYFTSKISGNSLSGITTSGATQSNFLCVYAGAFATTNYNKCVEAA